MAKEETTLTHLLWLDLEMTGLDPETCKIIEVAAIATDLHFKILGDFHAVVFQPEEVMGAMDEWCTKTHGESGLTESVKSGRPLEDVEADLLAFSRTYFPNQQIVLAGNSIWQDRRFIDRYMKLFSNALHYRMIDVSSFKEIYKSLYQIRFRKKDTHRAMSDIEESIAELKHYLSFIRLPEAVSKADPLPSN